MTLLNVPTAQSQSAGIRGTDRFNPDCTPEFGYLMMQASSITPEFGIIFGGRPVPLQIMCMYACRLSSSKPIEPLSTAAKMIDIRLLRTQHDFKEGLVSLNASTALVMDDVQRIRI
jgi:hypothetical protein